MLITLPALSSAQVSQNFLTDQLPPVYEMGMGAIGLNIPDYPGSSNNRFRVVPFPYYIYRGKYFRSDDEGTRARLLSSKFHEVGLSFGFNFPVNSGNSPARKGMPDLDALMEFGPRLLLRFLSSVPNHRLNFSIAARAVFSSKFSFNNLLRHEGYTFEPQINYWYRWKESKTTLFSSISFDFGTAKYNRYFFNVPVAFSTPTRPSYLSKSGLIETSLSLGAGQEINKELFIFGGGSWRNLDLAANQQSPLVETTNNFGFIMGLVWTFYMSDEKVLPLL